MVEINCGSYRNALTELARGAPVGLRERGELDQHLERCALCRATFEGQLRLSHATRVLAAAAAREEPPEGFEEALLAEFERARIRPLRRLRYGAAMAIAASLLAGWAGWAWVREARLPVKQPAAFVAQVKSPPQSEQVRAPETPRQMPRPRSTQRASRRTPAANAVAAAAPQENQAPFVSIPYTAPLAPYERAEVVRVELPVAALISAGLPFRVSDPGARARADLVVGEDGRARAVRLISISDSGSYRSIR